MCSLSLTSRLDLMWQKRNCWRLQYTFYTLRTWLDFVETERIHLIYHVFSLPETVSTQIFGSNLLGAYCLASIKTWKLKVWFIRTTQKCVKFSGHKENFADTKSGFCTELWHKRDMSCFRGHKFTQKESDGRNCPNQTPNINILHLITQNDDILPGG